MQACRPDSRGDLPSVDPEIDVHRVVVTRGTVRFWLRMIVGRVG